LAEGGVVAKGIMVVESAPADAEREAEYNEWYSGTHIGEIPGFVAARRYKIRGTDPNSSAKDSYLAVYEIEADDLDQPLAELAARSADGRSVMSDALRLSPPPVVTIYELIDEGP
jgi:hypothetical protein